MKDLVAVSLNSTGATFLYKSKRQLRNKTESRVYMSGLARSERESVFASVSLPPSWA